MATSFLTGPRPTRADSIYLHSVTDVYQTDTTSVYPGDSYWGPATDFTRYDTRYTRGLGYRQDTTSTNYNSRNYSANGTAKTDGCLNYSSFVLTNSITNGWLNGALTSGPNTLNTIYTESRWTAAGSNWTHSITLSIPDGDTNNSFSPPPSSQFQPAYYRGMDYVATTVGANGDGGTNTATTTILLTHTVKLETDAPTGGTGSALYRLTSGFDIPSGTNANVLAENAAKYTLANENPDTNGVVWKIFTDGTTNNDVSVRIRDTYTNAITNFTFIPTPYRATLVIEWKSPADSDDDVNWSSAPLFVLKGTTVDFRVLVKIGGATETNVAWPSGLPVWSNGSNGSTRTTILFDNVSGDTSGQWVTVTAGTMASNRVVVFDYQLKFKPEEAGMFEGRATNATRFGVGEKVTFFHQFDPPDIADGDAGPFDWTANGMSTSGAIEDRSKPPGPTRSDFAAGAFPETITAVSTIKFGPSAGKSRTNHFEVVKPTDARLENLGLTVTNLTLAGQVYTSTVLIPYNNVWHTSNTITCIKQAAYFLAPSDVSFHGITIREGAGPANWQPDNTNTIIQMITNSSGVNLFWITNSDVAWDAHRAWNFFYPVSHPIRALYGPVEPNYFGTDRFGVPEWPISVNLPVAISHPAQLVTKFVVTIPIEYTFHSGDVLTITNVYSEKELYTSGRVTIRKAGSGPHTKEFSDPDSPE